MYKEVHVEMHTDTKTADEIQCRHEIWFITYGYGYMVFYGYMIFYGYMVFCGYMVFYG